MNILVVCIHVVVCLVLIIVILLQAGRGQGLTGGSFGGGNVQSLFGTKASSFLTKATSVCAILFLFTCIGLNILEVQKSRSLFKSPNATPALDVEQVKRALAKLKMTDKAAATTNTKTDVAKTDAVKSAETLKKEVVTPVTTAAKKK